MIKYTLFSGKDLSEHLRELNDSIKQKIKDEPDNYILNCNETEYKSHLFESFEVDKLNLLLDQVHATEKEKMIPAEYFPGFLYNVESGRSYLKPVITFHIPFTGNPSLIRMKPSTYSFNNPTVEIENNTIKHDVIVFNQSAEQVDEEYKRLIYDLQERVGRVNSQIKEFNDSLSQRIESEFTARKQSILQRKNFLSSLSVPIKRAENVPQTFSVPTPARKKITPKPVVTENGFKPEPTISSTDYHEILQVIHDTGVMFERAPSTYSQKGEEDLRDHILMNLAPRFEGEVSGETFNKTGKTDILLRYQGENVFVGECKIWKGKKVFLDTISQLIGYLTWRDSKAAVIMFVKQKDISKVIKTVEGEISTHLNYLGFVSKQNDSWSNYRFHINGDKNREIKLAVLLVHIPE
ncbi:hypothetical protein [Bacillus mycoides]|uniref:hypothetical protein n=1 Tax=Bacillus mycoides TaxID=1405 RepID=UPI000A27B64E|nr:hypothetical protein [Bacillus mycoides]OSX87810.1 hypothetical protein BTJ44_03487 [Bacillus mycoides]